MVRQKTMDYKTWRDQITHIQRGLAESIAKGYSPVKAVNLELEALYWIPSISMDGAMALVLEAARLNGMMIQTPETIRPGNNFP